MIVGTSSLGSDETASIALMGDSGTGKTTVAAKFPKAVFLMLEDNGRNSVDLVAPETPTLYCSNMNDIREAMKWLKENQDNFDTVVVDSGTELDRFIMTDILDKNSRDVHQIQDYGMVAKTTHDVISYIRGLNMNAVFLYLTEVREYKDGTTKHVPLASGGKLQAKIPSLFSYVLKTCKFAQETPEGKVVLKFALETFSEEDMTLKVPPALQRSQHIPADPKRWLGLLLPKRYPDCVPTKKKGDKKNA